MLSQTWLWSVLALFVDGSSRLTEGTVEEGRLRQAWYYEGKLHDEVLMSVSHLISLCDADAKRMQMLRSEWEQLYNKSLDIPSERVYAQTFDWPTSSSRR